MTTSRMAIPRVDSPQESAPCRVVVAGGSYGGITSVLTLLDLIDGKPLRVGSETQFSRDLRVQRKLEIVLLDKREGFCRFTFLCYDIDGTADDVCQSIL